MKKIIIEIYDNGAMSVNTEPAMNNAELLGIIEITRNSILFPKVDIKKNMKELISEMQSNTEYKEFVRNISKEVQE
jgi:hypothetical protein